MKLQEPLLTMLLAGLFQSCTQEETNIFEVDRIELHTTIEVTPNGRASLSPEGEGQFNTGDHIRLFITPDGEDTPLATYELTRNTDNWLPQLSWKDIPKSNITFSATYPALSKEQTIHTLAIDQTTLEAYEQSDLLLARTCVAHKQPVNLHFSHALSRICISLSSNGAFSNEQLAEAQVRIRSKKQIMVNLTEATLGESQGEEISILAYKTTDHKFRAIVCPQNINPDWKEKGWIEIKIGDHTFTYKAPETLSDGTHFTKLETGKQISLNIQIKKQEEESWANRTVWIQGINNPPVDTWGYAFLTEKTPGLKWQPDYGWYDCNKIDPNRGGADSEMCWAATVSNMIHWWLDQNNTYIEQYGKYNGPRSYNSSIDSEVFNYFKKHFNNTGHDVAAALNWFFTGRYLTSTKPDGAFFKDVLGSDPIVRITRFGERTLTEEIQKAIRDKEVIGLTIQYPTYLHAVSLWGADFDEKGEVCAIYISDSNDRWLDEQAELFPPQVFHYQTPAGIIRKRVQHKADGVYMESSSPGYYTFKLEELNLINLMTEKWNAYFSIH